MTGDSDRKWMTMALKLAARGCGRTRPNPPVGAVVVKNGKLAGSGWHRKAGSDHAEVVALKQAGDQARGATLYITLEPCCTYGRTPPCTDAIMRAGLRRVVVAVKDPNPRHMGRGLALLKRAGIHVQCNSQDGMAERLLAPFAKMMRSGQPFVTLKLGMTADGKIADRHGTSRWITSAGSRKMVRAMRCKVDAVMVGAGTIIADDPSLLPSGGTGNSMRIAVDSKGRIMPDAQIFCDGNACRTIVATTRMCPAAKRKAFEASGATVLLLPVAGNRVSLRALMKKLGQMGLLHVLCEGGSELAESLTSENLVDEYLFFLAPMILGAGKPAFYGGNGRRLESCPRLHFSGCHAVGPDTLVCAVRDKKMESVLCSQD